MKAVDRRRFSRVNFTMPIYLQQTGQYWSAQLIDISLKGLLVSHQIHQHITADEDFIVVVPLSERVPIQLCARLVHQSAEQLGLEAIKIDLDSIAHLRRLIELNLGSAEAADRELNELIRNRSSTLITPLARD